MVVSLVLIVLIGCQRGKRRRMPTRRAVRTAWRSAAVTRGVDGARAPSRSSNLHHPGRRHGGVVGPDPANHAGAAAVAAGIEPVGHARIPVGHHAAEHPVVEHALMAVERGLVVGVVDRLPPLVADGDAPVKRGRRRDLDDERLVVGQVPRTPHRHVVGGAADVGTHHRRPEGVHPLRRDPSPRCPTRSARCRARSCPGQPAGEPSAPPRSGRGPCDEVGFDRHSICSEAGSSVAQS